MVIERAMVLSIIVLYLFLSSMLLVQGVKDKNYTVKDVVFFSVVNTCFTIGALISFIKIVNGE